MNAAEQWKAVRAALAPIRRLAPDVPVRIVPPEGESWIRCGRRRIADDGRVLAAEAVVLPAAIVLRSDGTAESTSSDDFRTLLETEVAAASPFPSRECHWGWRRCGRDRHGERFEFALAHRAHVEDHVRRLRQRGRVRVAEPELWSDAELPIILGGSAAPRLAAEARLRAVAAALCALMLLLGAALAATPLLGVKARVAALDARTAALRVAQQPALDARATLIAANAQLAAVNTLLDERADPLAVLARLSAMLPDDAYLTRVEIDGNSVRIAGLAVDASGLLQRLASDGALLNIRSLAPVAADSASGRDRFSAEFRWTNARSTP